MKIDAVKQRYIKYMIYSAVTKTLPCWAHFAYCWSYIRLCYPGSTLSSFIPPQQASTSGRADNGSKTEKAFAILDRSAERGVKSNNNVLQKPGWLHFGTGDENADVKTFQETGDFLFLFYIYLYPPLKKYSNNILYFLLWLILVL